MGYLAPFPFGTRVSQDFGANPNNGVNPAGGHTGRDYAVPTGTPVRAAGDGVIELSSWVSDNYLANAWWLTRYGGDMLVLNCGDNASTFIYAHLSESTADVGTRVRKGQIIGWTGNTGTATTGSHCHVEQLPPRWDFNNGTYGRVAPAFTEYPTTISTEAATIILEDIVATLNDDEKRRLMSAVDKINRYLDAPIGAIPGKILDAPVPRAGVGGNTSVRSVIAYYDKNRG